MEATLRVHNDIVLDIEAQEEKRRKRSLYFSIAVHILLLLILIIPFFSYEYPPPGQEGVLVSFGLPDQGQGNDNPDTQNLTPVDNPENAEREQSQPEVAEKSAPAPKPVVSPPVVTQEQPSEVSVPKVDPEAARLKAIAEAQAEAERKAEADRRAKAEAERLEAEAKAQALADKTKQFGQLFNGSGKGQTGSAGNQGDPNGDPNADVLKGITKGSGKVGGGLSNRGVMHEPRIDDRSQKTGRVVIKVCVDSSGKVVKANYTQRGSTTTDATLVKIAEQNAKKWTFTPSDITQQCGTITVDFDLQ